MLQRFTVECFSEKLPSQGFPVNMTVLDLTFQIYKVKKNYHFFEVNQRMQASISLVETLNTQFILTI